MALSFCLVSVGTFTVQFQNVQLMYWLSVVVALPHSRYQICEFGSKSVIISAMLERAKLRADVFYHMIKCLHNNQVLGTKLAEGVVINPGY